MSNSRKHPRNTKRLETLVYRVKRTDIWGFNPDKDNVEEDIKAYLETEKQQSRDQQSQEISEIQAYLNEMIIEIGELSISQHLQLEAEKLIQNLLNNLNSHPEQDERPHREIADATLSLLQQIPKQSPKQREDAINNYKYICQQHCEKIPEGKETILKALAKFICSLFGNRFQLFQPKPLDHVDLIVKKANKMPFKR